VILGLLAAAFALGALSFLTTVSPAAIRRGLAWAPGFAVAAVALFLILTGRGLLDVPLVPFILWLCLRQSGASLRQSALGSGGGAASTGGAAAGGATSAIETPWLRMALDRATGALDGEVLAGHFAGAPLARLDLEQLCDLHAECLAADEQSARLIEAYLDRQHPGWRDRPQARPSGRMSRDEALQILGLAASASVDQIREAHHRLMLKLHPDLGGTDYLAGQINMARDVLLHS
jgi:hypothetical protein